MLRTLIVCLTLSTLALTQNKDPQKQAPPPPSPAEGQAKPAGTPPSLLLRSEKPAELAPDQPVITVKGLCLADTAATGKTAAVPATQACVIKVSKQQFDTLVKAFNPNNQPMPPAQRRKLAEAYVELLIYSEAAKAAGTENTPTFVEVMRVLRLKTLTDLYRNQLAEQFRNPSQQEVEAYYQQNQSKFEGAKLSRIFLPKNNPDPKATAEQKQEYQKKAQQLADDIQARAGKGEEIEKLQKEAYVSLGITGNPPSTDLNTARRGMFPPKLEQEIFAHKAGEVFRADDANGYLIYRVENRQTVSLESVKDQIAQQMLRSKMEGKNKELTAPVHSDFDEGYFGPPAPPPGPTLQQAIPPK